MIAIPVALQSLLSVGVNMADNIMVGNLGETNLSGVAMANQFSLYISFFVRGLTGGAALLLSQYWGKKDFGKIKLIFAIVLRIAFLVGISATAVLALFPSQAMHIFSNDADIIREGAKYLQIVCFSYIFYVISDTFVGMLRCVEVVRITLIITIVSLFTNITFNYILIFGKFGFPVLGIRGAAIATVLARMIELAITLTYVLKVDKRLQVRFKELFGWDRLLVKDFAKYGLPVLIGDLQWGLVSTLRATVIGRLGKEMVSANSIAEVVMSLGFAFTTGLAAAACVAIGKTVGAGEYKKTREYSNTIQILFLGAGVFIAAFVFFTRGIPPSFYNISEETRLLTKQFLAIGALSMIGTAYHASCFVGINRGAGDSKFVFKVDMIFGWLIVLPATFLSGLVFGAPLWVVYFCSRIDQFFKWIIAFFRLRGDRWIRNVTR